MWDAIETRHSIREFTEEETDRTALLRFLKAANAAPSAHNAQPWRFVVLESPEARNAMLDAMRIRFLADMAAMGTPASEALGRLERTHRRIRSAPAAVLFCLALDDMDAGEAERLLAAQSVAAAVENFLLSAHAAGWGACWIGAPAFCPAEIAEALDLERNWIPQALILAGMPAAGPDHRDKRTAEDLTIIL